MQKQIQDVIDFAEWPDALEGVRPVWSRTLDRHNLTRDEVEDVVDEAVMGLMRAEQVSRIDAAKSLLAAVLPREATIALEYLAFELIRVVQNEERREAAVAYARQRAGR